MSSSYRVIRYDARGFGHSPAPKVKFTLLADLIAVLDHYALDRVAIVGCSQGGGSGLALALEQPARASIASGDLMQPDPPVLDRLGEIAVPTSLLVGDADYPPLIESNRQAAAQIPGCRLTVVPGMDHLPPLRDPDLVLITITTTLSRAGW
jgi:pimeloyl-ACP methyl ester carboxylesterase